MILPLPGIRWAISRKESWNRCSFFATIPTWVTPSNTQEHTRVLSLESGPVASPDEAHKRNFTVDQKQEAHKSNEICNRGVICLLQIDLLLNQHLCLVWLWRGPGKGT